MMADEATSAMRRRVDWINSRIPPLDGHPARLVVDDEDLRDLDAGDAVVRGWLAVPATGDPRQSAVDTLRCLRHDLRRSTIVLYERRVDDVVTVDDDAAIHVPDDQPDAPRVDVEVWISAPTPNETMPS